jgi:transaldolase
MLSAQGLNTFTINPNVAEQLFSEQPTIAAAAEFERAAASLGAP